MTEGRTPPAGPAGPGIGNAADRFSPPAHHDPAATANAHAEAGAAAPTAPRRDEAAPVRGPSAPERRRVFVRPRALVRCAPREGLTIGRLADVAVEPPGTAEALAARSVGYAPAAGRVAVLRVTDLARRIAEASPGAELHVLGDQDVVVEAAQPLTAWRGFLGGGMWLLLFIGAATAILNFHADVNLPAAHREIYRLLTGRSTDRPLVIEVPYAFGVAAGLVLFFHRFGRGRRAVEPSPLDIEVAQYERRLAEYWRQRPPGGV